MSDLESLLTDLTDGSEAAAEIAVGKLVECGSEALAALQKLHAHPEPETRWWVVRSLAEFNHPDVPDLLRKSLADPDPWVRQCAALALRKQPDPFAIPELIEALRGDDRMLARLAGDALVAIGENAVPALIDAFENSKSAARIEAIRALAKLDDMQAVPTLFSALEDDSALVEYWGDLGLQRRGVGMTFYKP